MTDDAEGRPLDPAPAPIAPAPPVLAPPPSAPPGKPTWRERWQWRRQDRAEGAPGPGTTADVEEKPLEPAPAPTAPARKLTWREKRWQRRRRRKMFEEILGWILVPIILVALYWGVKGGLNAAGTSPSAVVQAIKTLISGGGAQP